MTRIGVIVFALGVGLAGAAEAGLEICNHTGEIQSISIGYKGETDWTSEGWWNVDPGKCAELVQGDLTKRYYYYHANSKSDRFRGQDYVFCTRQEEFTIIGDTDCENRGYDRAEFREIDTGETAISFTLTLVANGAVPDPVGTGSKTPEEGIEGDQISEEVDTGTQSVTETLEERPPPVDERALQTNLPPGRNGEPFEVAALFQGCELEDGRPYCGFHANGEKLRAFYKGPTPTDLLYALEALDVNLPVMVEGDQVDRNRKHVAVVLRAITPRPGSDAMAELRGTIQGDWTLARDRRSEITIHGSEVYVRYGGDFRQTRFLELAERCEGLRGAGPVLIQTSLRDLKPVCYRVVRADRQVLELEPVAGGDVLRFQRSG